MSFKYFFAFTIIFCAALGVFTHSLGWEEQGILLLGEEIVLPMSVWFVLAVLLFFACSSLLFLYSWIADTMHAYRLNRDFENILRQIQAQMLGESHITHKFTNKYARRLSKILEHFDIKPLDSQKPIDDKLPNHLERAIHAFRELRAGKVADLRAFHLSKKNALAMWNLKNKIALEPKIALKIALEPQKFDADQSTRQVAVLHILKHADKDELRKLLKAFLDSFNHQKVVRYNALNAPMFDVQTAQNYENLDSESSNSENAAKISEFNASDSEKFFTHEMKDTLFAAYAKNREVFSLETLSKIFEQMDFDERDFVDFARCVQPILQPDEWYRLFSGLADLDENAESALFYVMFKLEMLDMVRERRAAHARDEFKFVDAYLDLREAGKRYDLDIFRIQENFRLTRGRHFASFLKTYF